MKNWIQQALDISWDYPTYRQHLTDLLEQGKTTGSNQSEFYLKIARLNQSRMKRLDKRTQLTDDLLAALEEVKNSYQLLALTEGWCGDAAQTLPLINKLAEASPQLDLRLVLRDENLDLMDLFLTDGGRSIPKVLFLDADTKEVVTHWGPRPALAQKMAMDYKYKPEPKEDYETHHLELHAWYTKDKTLSTQAELTELLKNL
ncbi:MAG: thioredoxin family protein [Bacteroidota bacterium]